ncbi:hypothetical protein U1Q18_009211 [Sarracenia purpurea var. burkii]
MEQAREKEQEDHRRRLKTAEQSENQPPHHHPPPQPHEPQKCPRCDSLNTKFCYYNNYSLSQPRYFCKACRRYWTQGGTLRNVPVGGGCRKVKRSKPSSSGGDNSRSQPPPTLASPPHPPPHEFRVPQIAPAPAGTISGFSAAIYSQRNKEVGNMANPQMISPYYSGVGFLQPFNQQLSFGGQIGGSSSNLPLLQGFNMPYFNSQQVQNQHFQQQMSSSDQILIQPNRHIASWDQNPFANPTEGTSTLNPNQWPDLPAGYGHGPPP